MTRLPLRYFAAAAAAAALCSTVAPAAQADPGVVVSPGMEIHQDSNVCTLGYVDPVLRIAISAGHCRGSGPGRPWKAMDSKRKRGQKGSKRCQNHLF